MARAELIQAVAVAAELTGAKFSEPAAHVLVERLASYDLKAVLSALDRCINELRRPLTLADVLERLDDGHLGPESAWALVGTLGEGDTVVWTPEIAESFEVARPMLHDKVASRMAFLEAYRERLAVARGQATPPRWWPSLGWDAGRRTRPLVEAVVAGRLSVAQAQRILPASEWPSEWSANRALPEAQTSKDQAAEVVAMLARRMAASAREDQAR